uniref:Retrotransposon gag domain-containing protein n=1 Tax=Sparus aurata TaxID=8175 RepID=A0A671U193_SPAAU
MLVINATPFLSQAGESPIPFATWQKFFDNYMLVINATGNAWPEARRRAVLLHCLGPEGQRLFYTLLDPCTMFDDAMAALEKHFVPKVNMLACRHTFRQRIQRTDETASQYVAALKALAAPCGFGAMESELIRDQPIANAHLCAVRDKLLLEEDLTLDKALTIACQVEAAVKNATLLSSAMVCCTSTDR